MITQLGDSRRVLATLTLLSAVISGPALGQDPFGSGDPFGMDALAPATPAPGTTAPTSPTEPQDPLLESVQGLTSDDPAELTRAVQLLLDYGKPLEAKKYLDKLVEQKLDEATLVELHNRFRSGLFFRIAGSRDLQPEGALFGDAVLDAARSAARSDATLTELLGRLSDPDPSVRQAAIVDLRDANDAGVNALLRALADPARSREHAAFRGALVSLLRPSSARAVQASDGGLSNLLIAATETDNASLRSQIIQVLGDLREIEAVPFLIRPAVAESSTETGVAAKKALLQIVGRIPERWEAEVYLDREAKAYLGGKPIGDIDEQGRAVIWRWDDTSLSGRPESVLAADASLVEAARLARELHLLAKDNPSYLRLHLLTRLATAKTLNGFDQPLPTGSGTARAEAAAAGPLMIEAVLEDAIERDQTAAAIASLEVLEEIGDVGLLISPKGRPRRLALAMRHPDRRVRFAATQAVIAIDPRYPFPGSSFLPDSLTFFAGTKGTRRVLIAHPRMDYGQSLAGMAAELGFDADTAQIGRTALLLAQDNPDYEFILISDAINRPPVRELLQQLRRDPVSRKLPIGLMARSENFIAMERLTDDDPLAEAFPRPHSANGLSLQAARLLARAGRDAVGFDERMDQATKALELFTELARQEQTYRFYNLLEYEPAIQRALETPQLTATAAQALGYLGTPSAQQALVTVAGQYVLPLRDRQAAADAFAIAVQRRGLSLTRDEILSQYDHYNQSDALDAETRQVLGSILDTIESRSRTNAPAATAGLSVQDEP